MPVVSKVGIAAGLLSLYTRFPHNHLSEIKSSRVTNEGAHVERIIDILVRV